MKDSSTENAWSQLLIFAQFLFHDENDQNEGKLEPLLTLLKQRDKREKEYHHTGKRLDEPKLRNNRELS